MIKEIKELYVKDPELAIQVAKALGYKINKKVKATALDTAMKDVLDKLKRNILRNAKALESNKWDSHKYIEALLLHVLLANEADKVLKKMKRSMDWYNISTF